MIRKAMKNTDAFFNQNYEKLIRDSELETLVHIETSFF